MSKIPYFTFFRCKREYAKEYLNRIPQNQHDESLEAEMASAYDRFFDKVRTENSNLAQVWLDGYLPSEDDENFVFVDWVGSTTGALSRWFNQRFETDVCSRDTSFIRLNFYDIIDLSNACAKACGEDDYADTYGINKNICKKYFPAEYRSDGDRSLYGADYCSELMATLRHMKKILKQTNFRTEFIYVIVKMV
jgi:hypothetical protein